MADTSALGQRFNGAVVESNGVDVGAAVEGRKPRQQPRRERRHLLTYSRTVHTVEGILDVQLGGTEVGLCKEAEVDRTRDKLNATFGRDAELQRDEH